MSEGVSGGEKKERCMGGGRGGEKATVINCFKRFYLNKNYLLEMCAE